MSEQDDADHPPAAPTAADPVSDDLRAAARLMPSRLQLDQPAVERVLVALDHRPHPRGAGEHG